MHPDMLILSERFVMAMESMSQDVKNISAYIYDLSYNVQQFLNEKRKKEDISQLSCDEDNSPSAPPPAGQVASAESEYSVQYEQADGRSMSHIHDLEHEEMSAQDAASVGIEEEFTEGIRHEEQLGGEENNQACDLLDTYEDDRNNVRELCEGRIQQPQIKHDAGSSNLQTSFSTLSFSLEAKDMKCEKPFSNACSSERANVLVENSQCQSPFAVASSSIADGSVVQGKAVERHLLVKHGEVPVAGASQKQCVGRKKANTGGTQRSIQGSALQSSSCGRARRRCTKRTFACPICKKIFESRAEFGRHIVAHTGEKPFKCSQCGKSFLQRCNLTRHMRTHTGEKPFRCKYCGNFFTQSGTLVDHLRIHTGERPFKCNQCGKAFRTSGHLSSHMKTHSGEMPSV